MKFLGKLIGGLVAAVGLGVLIFSLVALADPQGAQHADDVDPFGNPPSAAQLLLHITVGGALSALGLWLVVRKPQV